MSVVSLVVKTAVTTIDLIIAFTVMKNRDMNKTIFAFLMLNLAGVWI